MCVLEWKTGLTSEWALFFCLFKFGVVAASSYQKQAMKHFAKNCCPFIAWPDVTIFKCCLSACCIISGVSDLSWTLLYGHWVCIQNHYLATSNTIAQLIQQLCIGSIVAYSRLVWIGLTCSFQQQMKMSEAPPPPVKWKQTYCGESEDLNTWLNMRENVYKPNCNLCYDKCFLCYKKWEWLHLEKEATLGGKKLPYLTLLFQEEKKRIKRK